MSRLIDADALMQEFAEFVRHSNNSDYADIPTWNDAVSLVDSAPTVSPKQGRWYSVAKEMPKPGDWGVSVLVYTVDHEYHVWTAMPYRADNYCWDDKEGYCHDKWEAVAWMPLPEPWKGEEE